MRTSSNDISALGTIINGYDYKNQAWVRLARYEDCGHPPAGEVLASWPGLRGENVRFKGCDCYGRQHTGELCRVDTNGNMSEIAATMSDSELANALAVEALAL
jgi:hypothetical protein